MLHEIKQYVLGFRFSGNRTLLIRKERPEWQKGIFNGIGGHVEPRENFRAAMAREFHEETGIDTQPSEWEPCLTIDVNNTVLLIVLRSFGPIIPFTSPTDEIVEDFHIGRLPNNVMNDVIWMIPILLNDDIVFPLAITKNHRSRLWVGNPRGT